MEGLNDLFELGDRKTRCREAVVAAEDWVSESVFGVTPIPAHVAYFEIDVVRGKRNRSNAAEDHA